MADGQFDIRIAARSEIALTPPGADHFCIFKDSENGGALTEATGDPAVFSVLFNGEVEITAPQLTADVDDWDPSGMADATVVRMSSDAARLITGIEAGSLPASGKKKKLFNVGSFPITLKDQDVGSSGVNRFLLHGGAGDITLQPGDAQDIYYDDTDAKWRSA